MIKYIESFWTPYLKGQPILLNITRKVLWYCTFLVQHLVTVWKGVILTVQCLDRYISLWITRVTLSCHSLVYQIVNMAILFYLIPSIVCCVTLDYLHLLWHCILYICCISACMRIVGNWALYWPIWRRLCRKLNRFDI